MELACKVVLFNIACVMVEKKHRSKRLSQIVQSNKHFDRAVENYISQLRAKKDWQNLEKRLSECKKLSWPKDKLRKIFEWERKACDLHSRSLDLAMETIRHMADDLSDVQFDDLGDWIKKSSHSKDAWTKNVLSIDDPLPLIKAKIVHLGYMSRSLKPVNVGDMISGKE